MTDLTLFDTDTTQCGNCARTLNDGTCTWCAFTDPATAGGSMAVESMSEYAALAEHWLSRQPVGALICADDLVEALGLPTGNLSMRGNNSLGGLFRAWAHRKFIRKVGYVNSRRRSSHGTVIAQWQVQ